ncbi:sugar transferase [Agromyces ramosus]|uniref:Exopolysaccharide biosynthesis polyprenyl glycosylphosphotransferase n=1 Tax=Agromyces ramosus TaxID=33879 RepID=A0ABU0R878_9MICO|nr:sugar transferase [Agromyces ramosus]MDQ0894284.1 exopolysaccharide biosynthesis polyprenyl glycosylphosphotransferase [Agromyces ramosus]
MSTVTEAVEFGPPALPPRRARTHLRLVTPDDGSAVVSNRAWASRYRARLIVCDVLVVVATAIGAFQAALLLTAEPSVAATMTAPAALAAAVWLSSLAVFRTRDERLFAVGAGEYKRMLSASTIAIGIMAIAVLSLEVTAPRPYLLVAWTLGVPLLLLERWGWRRWLNHERQEGRALPSAVVVGDADDVAEVITRMNRGPVVYAVAGVAIEAPDQGTFLRAGQRSFPILGPPAGVVAEADRIGARAVIVAGGTSGDCAFVKRLGWQLEGTSMELVLATRLTEVAGPRIHFQIIDDLPLMHVDIPRFEGGKHVAKRGLDIAGAAIGLVALAPLLLAIALTVRLDSPGGAIFRQERIGRNGRVFTLLKFRSMNATAEQELAALLERNEGSGVLFKLHDDPRITRVGHVLRKYSLDELPQLWNVLVGDMSLVGPRPPLASEVAGYEAHVRRRLYLKPGLTGPWQVSGRSDLDWEESVRLDLHYIENWSLVGDLMLLWRTMHVVLHPVGAY